MNEEYLITLVVAVIGSGGFGAFVPWVLNRIDRRADSDPMHEGLRTLLFCKLRQIHGEMVDHDCVCDVDTKQTAEKVYKAYSSLGGNGTGTSMIHDIRDAHIRPEGES